MQEPSDHRPRIRSMTGFGHAEGEVEGMHLTVDIKTVNGRYLDIVSRLPKELLQVEVPIKKLIQSRLFRGRVEVMVNLEAGAGDRFELNPSVVRNYLELGRQVEELGAVGFLDVAALLQLPGTLAPRRIDFATPQTEADFLEVVSRALHAALAERSSEGESLRQDLLQRIERLQGLGDQVERQFETIRDHYREKLSQKVERMAADFPTDPSRLAQEVLFYSERADIAEELTRLKRHLGRFQQHLASPPRDCVGKDLDFLCQELNRETNTILSKAQAADLAEIALRGKGEVERIREQVQNVE